jgi:pimeloyl-ACP methyl ester carboxylesterase
MKVFTSFDNTQIACQDEGQGPPVILLHGYGVDALGQFGPYDGILPVLEKRQKMFMEVFGGSPPLPTPLRKEGPAFFQSYVLQALAPCCPTCADSTLRESPGKRPLTLIQQWPET